MKISAVSIQGGGKNLERACVCFSIVSHNHGVMVVEALTKLALSIDKNLISAHVMVTLNVEEDLLEATLKLNDWPFTIEIIKNEKSQGFSANHNCAFVRSSKSISLGWYVVMNPDIYWSSDSNKFWTSLRNNLYSDNVGCLCPEQVDIHGFKQDYARELMTPLNLICRVLHRFLAISGNTHTRSAADSDWVNGACMVWRANAFREVGGFDEKFFMYCEDADICLRAKLLGWNIIDADVTVIHDARRDSKKSLSHMYWHISSLFRFWASGIFWRYLFRYV